VIGAGSHRQGGFIAQEDQRQCRVGLGRLFEIVDITPTALEQQTLVIVGEGGGAGRRRMRQRLLRLTTFDEKSLQPLCKSTLRLSDHLS
jgi:hypothetical protein